MISKAFPCAIIINPNTDIEQDRGNAEIMKDCLSAVDKCDVLVFSSVNGVIGKGVYDEFHRAKVTYYINNNMIEPFYGSFEIIPDSATGRLFAIVKN